MELVLEGVEGPAAGARHRLSGDGEVIVGRGSDATLRVGDDALLSRHHFSVELRGGRCTVSDLGSANGTLLDDGPVTGHAPANDGALIAAGASRFQIRLGRVGTGMDRRGISERRVQCVACRELFVLESATVVVGISVVIVRSIFAVISLISQRG